MKRYGVTIMKIAVIGASGKAGSFILKEAVERGHQVTAIVRDASKVTDKNVAVIEKSIFDLTPEDLKQFEVVVNAFGAPLGEEQAHVDAGHALIEALKGTNTRAIVVGGAGSLYVDEKKTVKVIDTPGFPDIVKPTAKGQGRNLQELQETTDITWTFISPSAVFDAEGKKTGSYQTGKDNLLVNSKGDSYISYADYAIAVLDEIENPQHLNERFTVVGDAE
jgi:putative NADH-flavin reductase